MEKKSCCLLYLQHLARAILFVIAGLLCTFYLSAQTKSTTAEQIGLIIKEKKSRIAIERKIDSRLLQAIREKPGMKNCERVKPRQANVQTDKKGNVMVDITANVTDTLINKIKAAGGSIIFPSTPYHTIRAEINLATVYTIAGYPEVKFIEPAAVTQLEGPVKPGKMIKTRVAIP